MNSLSAIRQSHPLPFATSQTHLGRAQGNGASQACQMEAACWLEPLCCSQRQKETCVPRTMTAVTVMDRRCVPAQWQQWLCRTQGPRAAQPEKLPSAPGPPALGRARHRARAAPAAASRLSLLPSGAAEIRRVGITEKGQSSKGPSRIKPT